MSRINLIAWADGFTQNLAHGRDVGVPCGDCTACCRSHMFILIRPSDYRAKGAIPQALRFSAPGLPEGFEVLGFDEQGRCPMLTDDYCSVYYDRALTCRQFDCRVYPATGQKPDEPNMLGIYQASQSFELAVETETDRQLDQIIQSILKAFATLKSPTRKLVPQYSSARLSLAIEIAMGLVTLGQKTLSEPDAHHAIEQFLQQTSQACV